MAIYRYPFRRINQSLNKSVRLPCPSSEPVQKIRYVFVGHGDAWIFKREIALLERVLEVSYVGVAVDIVHQRKEIDFGSFHRSETHFEDVKNAGCDCQREMVLGEFDDGYLFIGSGIRNEPDSGLDLSYAFSGLGLPFGAGPLRIGHFDMLDIIDVVVSAYCLYFLPFGLECKDFFRDGIFSAFSAIHFMYTYCIPNIIVLIFIGFNGFQLKKPAFSNKAGKMHEFPKFVHLIFRKNVFKRPARRAHKRHQRKNPNLQGCL